MALFDVLDDIAERQVLKTETGDNRIFGVVVGQVVNNYDESMPGRVCVSVTVRDSEANELKWARIAAPFGGSKWGSYFLPEVGDQVLLVFEGGNIEKPYVIGCVQKDNDSFLKKAVDEHNQFKKIQTKNGNTIFFEDNVEGEGEKDKIKILTAKEMHRIELDNENHVIKISDKDGKNKIQMKTAEDSGQMEIIAAKKLTVKVGDTIELILNGSNGMTKLKTKNLEVDCDDNMKMTSTKGEAKLGGASMKLESNSGMDIKGGAVTITGMPISIG